LELVPLGPILTPGAVNIITEFNTEFTHVAVLTGYRLLAMACAGPVVVVLVCVRGNLLDSSFHRELFITIRAIVEASAQTPNALCTGRIVQSPGAEMTPVVRGDHLLYLYNTVMQISFFSWLLQ
jgi:hypothetical protein